MIKVFSLKKQAGRNASNNQVDDFGRKFLMITKCVGEEEGEKFLYITDLSEHD